MEEGRGNSNLYAKYLKKNLVKKFPASFPPFPPQTHNLLLLNNCCYMDVYVYTRAHMYM